MATSDDVVPQKGRSAPMLTISKPDFFSKLHPDDQKKIEHYAQQSIRYHGDKDRGKRNDNVIMDLKTKMGLTEERAQEVCTWVETKQNAERAKKTLESGVKAGEPEWFSAMYPDQKKVVLQNLSDGLNTYGAVGDSLYKYMEENCGLLPNQTEEAYHFLLAQKSEGRPPPSRNDTFLSIPSTNSDAGIPSTRMREISLSTDDKHFSSDFLETYISDLRIWRDPLVSGSWFLFGLLVWFLLVVGNTSVLSLFCLAWLFFITICATFVNSFAFWLKFASKDVPRIGENAPPKEPYQIPEEIAHEVSKWMVSFVNDSILSITYVCSCQSNIDTVKVLFKLAFLSLMGHFISGASVAFCLYCNFFLGNLIWSSPTMMVWYGTISERWDAFEQKIREWCEKQQYAADNIIGEKKLR